jgi:signal transduction histidine kinase/DNA-binding response OmpR family regulator
MLPPKFQLRDFLRAVPLCLETADLATLIAVLRNHASDCLVLTTPQQVPIGLIYLVDLLPYLTADFSAPESHPVLPDTIIRPITLLSSQLSFAEVLPYLQATRTPIGLLDEQERFLGLLESETLLRAFVAVLPAARSSDQPAPSPPGGWEPWSPETEQPLAADLSIHPASATWISTSGAVLLELLERLPLPLRLQTSSGEVLIQNVAWQEQISDLTDPLWVGQEAASLLELTTAAIEATRSAQVALPQEAWGAPAACHLGSVPNTCICVCTRQNGQEQVLQFVKIPLGVLPNAMTTPAPEAFGRLEPIATAASLAGLIQQQAESALPHRVSTHRYNSPDWSSAASSERSRRDRASSESAPRSESSPVEAPAETLWLLLVQDVTEQRQLARELTAKNADLIQLNRLKDEFLACISHELRTPLTAILGLSSLLKDQTLGDLNARQVHYAQLIYQSGRHLMSVVNDILDLTRIETGQLELLPEPVPIAAVCHRALEHAKQARSLDQPGEARELPEFLLEIEPGLDLLIADELRLRQMLSHLLSNAIKFTEPDQQFGLKVGHWGGWIAFTVWDTGIGIPLEKQHLIFQKFQQLENPMTRRFEGTGLGLVLTQRLARLHGGDVTFVSQEGQGSQFTILLPPRPADAALTAPSAQPDSAPRDEVVRNCPVPFGPQSENVVRVPLTASLTPTDCAASFLSNRDRLVLLVEAAPLFIDTLSNHLSGMGYRVVIARSGTEALEKARRLQPCIIFLNPMLPLLSGWDVLTLLKSDSETQQIPVVITSTQVDEAEARRSQSDGFLGLPVQIKALRRSLQTLVETQASSVVKSSPLTVLRLSPGLWSANLSPLPVTDLTRILHSHHYRILEADDLEQAELLVRVWKPNVVLLDGALANATEYFQHYQQQVFLAALPLVTLEPEATQAANQVPGLLVFPCLATPDAKQSPAFDQATSALLQVIQVAAGHAWRPLILAVNPVLMRLQEPDALSRDKPLPATDWLQALTQYLQTAGFRSEVGRSTQEVRQQVESTSVNLLLIYWTETSPRPETLQLLECLHQLQPSLPILVLDHRHRTETWGEPALTSVSGAESRLCPEIAPLPELVQTVATRILPSTLSMTELLHQIQQLVRSA